MISDNATCFKNVKLSEELTSLQIKWKFIIEASPWWGGFWEWLVQSTKRILRKSLFCATVTYEAHTYSRNRRNIELQTNHICIQ